MPPYTAREPLAPPRFPGCEERASVPGVHRCSPLDGDRAAGTDGDRAAGTNGDRAAGTDADAAGRVPPAAVGDSTPAATDDDPVVPGATGGLREVWPGLREV